MSELLCGGVRLSYEQAGPRNASAVLLLRGYAAKPAAAQPFIAALAAHFHVLTLDLVGYGSSAPVAEVAAYGIGRQAENAAALLTELGVACAFVAGHGVGGLVAQAVALAHGRRLRGLILADTTPEPLAAADTGRSVSSRASGTIAPVGVPRITQTGEAPPAAEQFRASADASVAAGVSAALSAWPGCLDRIETITAPTLVLVGEADAPFLQRGAELLHGWIPSSRLVRIPDAGHNGFADNPAAFSAEVLAFLREIEAFEEGQNR